MVSNSTEGARSGPLRHRLHLAVKAANFDLTNLPVGQADSRAESLFESVGSTRLRTNNGNLDRT